MRTFLLTTSTWLPGAPADVFGFFAEAGNLQAITPAWLRFEVLTPAVEMRRGAVIDYRLRLRGIPLRWQSEITSWDPPFEFVDEQRRGPYRLWRHLHTFEASEEGTLASDRVEYAVLGGRIVNRLIVAHDLRQIFTWRSRELQRIFGVVSPVEAQVVIRSCPRSGAS
jgi:ligand-binding SRPBCC domain-containing protein